jgi:hypothetical protein
MSRFCRICLTLFVVLPTLSTSVLVTAGPATVPEPARPEHQRKAHTKLSGVLMLPRSDWEKGKFNQARIGDFVEYQTGDGERMYRRTVEELGDHTLVVLETKFGNRKGPTSHISYSFELPDETPGPGNSVRESADRIDVLGQSTAATLREVVYKNKPLERSWYSDDVPLGGLVKHVGGDGKIKQVLSAYGRGK